MGQFVHKYNCQIKYHHTVYYHIYAGYIEQKIYIWPLLVEGTPSSAVLGVKRRPFSRARRFRDFNEDQSKNVLPSRETNPPLRL